MNLHRLLICVATLWMALPAPAGAAIHETHVDGGMVMGSINNGVASFKGIPFAAPPIGPLRWKAPQPVIPWKGLRKADSFALPCAQTPVNEDQSSEDCLYLNVWTGAANPAERRPVMVWIHGGAFNWGATRSWTFDGSRFAEYGVVLVSVAYRLGAFGFLAHPQLSRESGMGSGAYGLQDQIAALKWVQQNITQFGGDPTRVTIFGASSGAVSVSLLAAAPSARGLFHRAISESGGAFNHGQLPSLEVAEATGQRFLRELGAADVAAARSMSVDRLLEATGAIGSSIFAPLIDGNIVRAPNVELYRAGLFNDTPILLGLNSDDRDEIPASPTSVAFAEQYQSLPAECATLGKAVVAGYPHGTDAMASKAFKDLKRDAGMGWQTWTWARAHARKGKGAVYVYFFEVPSPKWPDGAPHGAEVLYVFRNLGAEALPEDKKVSDMMQRYWINFASTGDPNGPGLPRWPAFDERAKTAMIFDQTTSARPLPHANRIETFDRLLACVNSKTGQQITKPDGRASTSPDPDFFTGSARIEPLFNEMTDLAVAAAYVHFEPGSRSVWHTHPAGQRLVVTAGVGRTQEWGKPVQEIRVGDVVICPPGVKHWHGASPEGAMTHLAITGSVNGKLVEWFEKVTDEQYLGR